MTVDVLAVGAHPDDVEIGIGGFVHKLVSQGHSVGVLDLTRGEMGSRGTPEERLLEAAEAAKVLGVVRRENAALPDGHLTNCTEQRLAVIRAIRSFRPRVLLVPLNDDLHPDHNAACSLCADANHLAGLVKMDPESDQEPYRTPTVYFYRVYGEPTPPQMIMDVSEHFEAKQEALRAYKSQFYNPEYEGRSSFIATEAFWESIKTRAAYWGTRIGTAYAEPLYARAPLPLTTLPGLE